MTAYEQRSYAGNASDTLLNADLAAGGASFSVTPGTGSGYPDGSSGPFFVFVDYDNSKIEKIRCSGRINDTFTVAGTGGGRGQDGTTNQAHTANAKVRHGLTATDAQEANRAAAGTVGLVTSKGDMLAGTGANAMARVPVGADTAPLVADSTQASGVRFDDSPWTTYTPALTNITVGNGSMYAAYRRVGKFIAVRFSLTFGSTTTITSIASFTLPATAISGPDQALGGAGTHSGLLAVINGRIPSNTNTCQLTSATTAVSAAAPWTWASPDSFGLSGTYEAA